MSKIELRNITKAYDKNESVISDLNLKIKGGSFTVLLGPSGCGKSTILRMIAGLEKETAGEIFIDGVSMKDVDPSERQIAMVFQNYALYPTMTVRGNIEFGLKNMKISKNEIESRVKEISAMVGLEEYLERKPQHLSGGQRQRVALARAIVKKPAVFLMDEPLSNLDAKLRTQIRSDLIELYRKLNTTFVYVTHDQVEAMSMGTDIILLEKGEIRHQGCPENIYSAPSNLFTAKFIGSPPMNIISAQSLKGTASGMPQEAVFIGFRPEKAFIEPEDKGAIENMLHFPGEILAREMLGDFILYKIQTSLGIVFVKTFTDYTVEYGRVMVYVAKNNLAYFNIDGNNLLI